MPLHARLLGALPTVLATQTPRPEVAEVRAYWMAAVETCATASDMQVMNSIVRLQSHYPTMNIPEPLTELRWGDWYSDMKGIPADVIEAACATWRRSEERYAPTPGQLLAIARPMVKMRAICRDRAERLLALLGAAA